MPVASQPYNSCIDVFIDTPVIVSTNWVSIEIPIPDVIWDDHKSIKYIGGNPIEVFTAHWHSVGFSIESEGEGESQISVALSHTSDFFPITEIYTASNLASPVVKIDISSSTFNFQNTKSIWLQLKTNTGTIDVLSYQLLFSPK